ncbi:hypothetical protein T484DRAFT_1812706 [Baffinella frigidus]|nr:hypothetical protein T484DRAFT_1812706 [Cryptophyta sp. CCMP2293]
MPRIPAGSQGVVRVSTSGVRIWTMVAKVLQCHAEDQPSAREQLAFSNPFDLYGKSPESGELGHKPWVSTKRICDHDEGWWEDTVRTPWPLEMRQRGADLVMCTARGWQHQDGTWILALAKAKQAVAQPQPLGGREEQEGRQTQPQPLGGRARQKDRAAGPEPEPEPRSRTAHVPCSVVRDQWVCSPPHAPHPGPYEAQNEPPRQTLRCLTEAPYYARAAWHPLYLYLYLKRAAAMTALVEEETAKRLETERLEAEATLN